MPHLGEKSEDRLMVSVRLSPEAARGWREFCRKNGISLTAFMEVAGVDLANDLAPSSIPERQRMVEQAREIDISRRERRPV